MLRQQADHHLTAGVGLLQRLLPACPRPNAGVRVQIQVDFVGQARLLLDQPRLDRDRLTAIPAGMTQKHPRHNSPPPHRAATHPITPISVHPHHTEFGVNESPGNPVTDGYRKYDKLGVEKIRAVMTGSPAQRPARRSAVARYRYRVARLTPRYLAMSLPVCPSAFIRFAVGRVLVSSMRWMVAGVGDTTNHAESGTPSER